MSQQLKFEIYGVPRGEDEAVFQVLLRSTTVEFLLPIMGWSESADAAYDYLLSSCQLDKIEAKESLSFPRDLDLYISCYV